MARPLVALLVAVLLLGPDPGLHADPGTVPRLPWFFDGAVLASARLGNTLYVGGTFTAVAPSASAMPPVYALSDTTGAVAGPPFPAMDGDVAAIEPDGGGGYFLGGSFTVVGAVAQPYLVHVLADGSVDQAFRPALAGPVGALARAGGTLYVRGLLDAPALQPQVGAVACTDGTRLAWRPTLPTGIESIGGLLATDDRVVLWGTSHIPMITTGVVAAYDASTAARLWETGVSGGVQRYGSVSAVLRAGDQLVVASSDGLRRLSLAAGAIDPGWNPQAMPSVLALAGSTLYLGGAFASVAGQPRQNLAAIDVASAALLPWNPRAPAPITRLATTGAGAVYVSGEFSTFNGQPRSRLARLEANGTLSPWVPAVPPGSVSTMREGAGGVMLIASALTGSAQVARRGLAAFDLDSGTLLPWAPGVGPVRFLAAGGDRVWAGVGGATFAFDATTGIDVDVVGYSTPFFADDEWLYRASWSPETETLAITRADLSTGAVDPSWAPAVFEPESVAREADTLFFASGVHGLAAVDRRTARVRWTNPGAAARLVAVSGDTLFTYSSLGGLESFDARTGAPVRSRIWTPPFLEALGIADGRLTSAGYPAPALVTLDGQALTWNLGLRRTLAGFGGHVSVAGDLLVLGSQYGRRLPDARQGLMVLPLDGQRALSELRARPAGEVTTFSWRPPTAAPAGGYVVEASTVPGATQIAIPVGHTTSFSAEVPVGQFFVRVRTAGAPGGTEQVSNEIRVRGGCDTAPAPPAALTAQLGPGSVTLSWTAPDAIVTQYIVEAGSSPGRADLASIARPGSQTTLTASAPAGRYHVRVRAANGCGLSVPSAGVYFTIGAAGALPGAPSGLRYQFLASREAIAWTPPAGEVTGYILEAGTDLGLSNLLVTDVGPYPTFPIPPFTTPRGTYIVRVRAVNAAGVGPPSEDFVLRLQ